MRTSKIFGLTLAIFLILFCAKSALASWSVWAEPLLIDKPKPAYDSPSKPTSISLRGAKGEWLAFYILARVSGESINGWTPSVQSTLTSGGNTIADSNWTFYMVQMVTTTFDSYGDGRTGEWPDPCVPYKDRLVGQTRNGSQQGWNKSIDGTSIARTQPFLYEIYIPENTVAGTYTGTVRLAGSGGKTQDISVTLTVWNFTLPRSWTYGSTFALDSVYGGTPIATVLGTASNSVDLLTRSAVDHGIWLYGGAGYYTAPVQNTSDGSWNFNSGTGYSQWVDSNIGYKTWLDGVRPNVSTNPRPYYGVRPRLFGVKSGNTMANAFSNIGYDAVKIDRTFDDWGKAIATNGWGTSGTKFIVRMYDEETSYSTACTNFYNYSVHAMAYKPPEPNRTYLYTAQTVGNSFNQYPFINPKVSAPGGCASTRDATFHISWSITSMGGFYYYMPNQPNYLPQSPRSNWDTRVNTYGDHLMVYSANRQAEVYKSYVKDEAHCVDSWYIDTRMGGRENAASALSMWIWNVSGFHYYEATNGFNETTWANLDPGRFGANGDGFIWYGGKASSGTHQIGGTNNIPIESLRMKLWRYGMNILEYATLLKTAGKTSIANVQIAKMLQMTPSSGSSWGSVSTWESARETMANEILGNSAPMAPKNPRTVP